MNSLDKDAELIGIDPKTWKEFKRMTDPKYVQDDLPYFQQQDEKEAFERHKQAMTKRWFGYYKKCKDKKKKLKLIDQYNLVATMRQRG